MQFKRLLFFAAICTFGFSAASAVAAQDLQSVLSRMDAASAKFHTTSADVEFTTTQTHPIPDTDVKKGAVYYKRDGSNFQMGVHIETDDGQPSPKVVVCCMNGAIKLYDKLQNQVTTLSKLSQYESWFMLGFGASGKSLRRNGTSETTGAETVDGDEGREAGADSKGSRGPARAAQSDFVDGRRTRGEPEAVFRRGTGTVAHLPLHQHQGESVAAQGRVSPSRPTRRRRITTGKPQSPQRKDHGEAFERVTRLGSFHGEQQQGAQHHVGGQRPPEARAQAKPDSASNR